MVRSLDDGSDDGKSPRRWQRTFNAGRVTQAEQGLHARSAPTMAMSRDGHGIKCSTTPSSLALGRCQRRRIVAGGVDDTTQALLDRCRVLATKREVYSQSVTRNTACRLRRLLKKRHRYKGITGLTAEL